MSNNIILQVKTQSWDKQQHELYDHQIGYNITNNFQIQSSGFFYRNNQDNQTYFSTDFELIQQIESSEIFKILFVVKVQEEGIFIGSLMHHQIGEVDDLWIRAIGNDSGFHQIKKNDVVKIGKKSLKLVELNIEGAFEYSNQYGQMSQYDSFYSVSDMIKDSKTICTTTDSREYTCGTRQCRICLGSTHNHENPLVSICKCSGSMRLGYDQKISESKLHNIKVKQKLNLLDVNYVYRSFHHNLTFKIRTISIKTLIRVYNLYSLNTSDSKNYLIFEDENGLLIITKFLSLNDLILGRGHQSQIKISEITVSRDHLQLRLQEKKIFIKDLNSKFGTLIKQQKLKILYENDQIQLQSGRTLIDLKVPKIQKGFFSKLCTICNQ